MHVVHYYTFHDPAKQPIVFQLPAKVSREQLYEAALAYSRVNRNLTFTLFLRGCREPSDSDLRAFRIDDKYQYDVEVEEEEWIETWELCNGVWVEDDW